MKTTFAKTVSFLAFGVVATVSTVASANCPYYTQPQLSYRPAGTEVRRWVTDTQTEWRNSNFGLEISPNSTTNGGQSVRVEQIHTQFWQAEVISRAATAQCEVIGYSPRTIPGECTSSPSQYPSQYPTQQQTCTQPQVVQDPVYGWKVYPEESEVQNLPNRETVVSTRDFWIVVNIKGQVLQNFEKEILYVSVDENGNAGANFSRRYNNYNVTQEQSGRNQTTVNISGTGRDMSGATPATSEMFRQGPQLVQNGNRVYIKLEVSPEVFHPENNPEAKIKFTYQAWQSSGARQTDYRLLPQLATRSVYMTPGNRYMEIDVTGMGRGRNAMVKFYINFEGSKWYRSSTIELDPLTMSVK